MSDDELRATPYAELWLSELGAHVPEWHGVELRHQPPEREPLRRRSAPDPRGDEDR